MRILIVGAGVIGTVYGAHLAAVRADQLASACAELTGLQGEPAVLFFGNNPGGRDAEPEMRALAAQVTARANFS